MKLIERIAKFRAKEVAEREKAKAGRAEEALAVTEHSCRACDGRRYNTRMAADIFAKIADIKGESADAKHKDEIEVLSFSWGVTNPRPTGGGGGGGAGKATFQDLSIVHRIDKASPQLLLACATGKHLPDATITHRKAGKGQLEYLVVKMNDVVITGVHHGGGPEGSWRSP